MHLSDYDAPIYVAGHRGLLGKALVQSLIFAGYHNIIVRTRAELDLRDQAAVAVEDLRRQRRPVALVYVEAANVPRSRARQADGGADRNGDQQADDNPYSGNEGSPPGRRRWREKKRPAPPRGDRPTLSGAGTKRSKLGGELNLATDTLIIDSQRRNLRGSLNPPRRIGGAARSRMAALHTV